MDQLENISPGWRGTDETVAEIYRLVDESLTDPLVVRTARGIVRNVPERDQLAESKAISSYVRSHVRYTRESVETLASPHEMVEDILAHGRTTGDCDEYVTLSLAFHKIIGIPVRAVVISQRDDRVATHIFGQAYIKGRWITMDDIVKKKPYGWAAPMAHRSLTKNYDVAGLGSYQEDFGMNGSKMVGRTRMVRSDFLMPRRQYMVGPSVSSVGFKLKPSGMLYAGEDGSLSGVGVDPDLGLDFAALVKSGQTYAATARQVYQDVTGKGKTAAAPPQAPPGKSPSMMTPKNLAIGAAVLGGLWYFLRGRK